MSAIVKNKNNGALEVWHAECNILEFNLLTMMSR